MGSLPPSLSVSCSFVIHSVDRSFIHSLDCSFDPTLHILSQLMRFDSKRASKGVEGRRSVSWLGFAYDFFS